MISAAWQLLEKAENRVGSHTIMVYNGVSAGQGYKLTRRGYSFACGKKSNLPRSNGTDNPIGDPMMPNQSIMYWMGETLFSGLTTSSAS